MIDEAERTGQQLPLDYLLARMRDPAAELRDRDLAAAACLPYCHPRFTVLRVVPEPGVLSDIELATQVERYERRAALMNESERVESLERDLQHLLEEVPRLSIERREIFFGKLIEASETGLQQLENEPDPPGTVIPRAARRREPEPEPASSGDQWLDYDPTTRKLRRPA